MSCDSEVVVGSDWNAYVPRRSSGRRSSLPNLNTREAYQFFLGGVHRIWCDLEPLAAAPYPDPPARRDARGGRSPNESVSERPTPGAPFLTQRCCMTVVAPDQVSTGTPAAGIPLTDMNLFLHDWGPTLPPSAR